MIVEVFKCKNCGWSGSPEDVLYSREHNMVQCGSCLCELMQCGILHAEFGEIPHWKLEVVMPHFQNIVRHSIWEEMGSPEPVHKKIKWWRRIRRFVINLWEKEPVDESPDRQDNS